MREIDPTQAKLGTRMCLQIRRIFRQTVWFPIMGLTRPRELPMRWVDYGGHPKQDMKGIVVQVKKAGEGHIMLLGEDASAYAQIHDIMSVQNIST